MRTQAFPGRLGKPGDRQLSPWVVGALHARHSRSANTGGGPGLPFGNTLPNTALGRKKGH